VRRHRLLDQNIDSLAQEIGGDAVMQRSRYGNADGFHLTEKLAVVNQRARAAFRRHIARPSLVNIDYGTQLCGL
jgi:hypothetical protein